MSPRSCVVVVLLITDNIPNRLSTAHFVDVEFLNYYEDFPLSVKAEMVKCAFNSMFVLTI